MTQQKLKTKVVVLLKVERMITFFIQSELSNELKNQQCRTSSQKTIQNIMF